MWAVLLPLAWVAVMLLIGFALAAVQLLPMAELAVQSVRQAEPSYSFASRFEEGAGTNPD